MREPRALRMGDGNHSAIFETRLTVPYAEENGKRLAGKNIRNLTIRLLRRVRGDLGKKKLMEKTRSGSTLY